MGTMFFSEESLYSFKKQNIVLNQLNTGLLQIFNVCWYHFVTYCI